MNILFILAAVGTVLLTAAVLSFLLHGVLTVTGVIAIGGDADKWFWRSTLWAALLSALLFTPVGIARFVLMLREALV